MTTTLTPEGYRMRQITPDDRVGLTAFYAALSPDSRAARFHGAAPRIPEATARFFCGPDHQHREGIVAECLDTSGGSVIIGHVCIEPVTDDVAEVAIAVADAWHGRGVGCAMLARAVIWAQAQGIGRLAASIRCGNAAMFGLLRSMDYPITYGASAADATDAYLDLRTPRPLAA
jgi:RimJ/RimL family protein N-acetyltransferase